MTTTQDSRTEYHGDQPTTEDLLGFREHAQHLADEISHFDPNLPMVVGIEGKWGEGKTSFFMMMEEYWRNQHQLPPEKPKLRKGLTGLLCLLVEYAKFLCEYLDYFVHGCVNWWLDFFCKLPREQRNIRLIKFDPW